VGGGGGVSGRTIVKYGDRSVRYVYIAAVQPTCRIMGAPKGMPSRLCVCGLGSCALGGWLLGAGRESSSMIFSRGGRNNSDRCRRMVDQAEIHRKVASGDVGERRDGVEQLSSNFADLPDKDAAWKDLIRLTVDKDSDVRRGIADVLGSAFPHVSNNDEAWKDLIRLTGDEYFGVRRDAAFALGSAFPHVSDKDAAWEDLHRLHYRIRRIRQMFIIYRFG